MTDKHKFSVCHFGIHLCFFINPSSQEGKERAYTSSSILEATITLVTSNLWTLRDMTRESGCLCTSLSIYTYPTTKQEGLQLVYLYILSKYLGMLMLGALTPWKTFKLFPMSPMDSPTSPSFRATSLSIAKASTARTLGVVDSTPVISGRIRWSFTSSATNI